MTPRRLTLLAAALGALALPAAAAQGKVVTKTFSSGNLSTPVETGGFVALKKNVKARGTIKDVDLSLRMSAVNSSADLGQLLTLRSPAGVLIGLSGEHTGLGYGSGAASCAGTPTVFDDSASGGFGDPGIVSPYAMRVLPDEQLAGLNGYPAQGRWDLQIASNYGNFGTRTVNCWSLTIKYKAAKTKKFPKK